MLRRCSTNWRDERLPQMCWFLDAGNKEPPQAHLTGVQKAPRHEVAGSWALAGSECEVDLMPAPRSMVSATRVRGDVQCLHTGEKVMQCASRQARKVQQWTANELIDGYRFERRQPGRRLPQLPRFGMSVAQA